MKENQSQSEQFIELVRSIINNNIDNENFSVEDLAKEVGLSRSTLHRKLIKLLGHSASDLITETRLLKAKQMLESDAGTTSEIAYGVGFNSPSYFNKVFKKRFGISPGEVRKISKLNRKNSNAENLSIRGIKAKFRRRIVAFFIIAFIITSIVAAYKWANRKTNSLAVLPIHNLTGNPDNDYFTAGIHDALIGELSKIGNLRVISRTSTLGYKDGEKLMKEIANELDVNILVEASLVALGDSLKFIVQVIDVFPKERHVLASVYSDELKNILNIHSAVVTDIVGKIGLKLSDKEKHKLEQIKVVVPESFNAYLRGMHYINKGGKENFIKGMAYLREAIDRDPADPFAYAALSMGYAFVGHGQLNPAESFNVALKAANTALEIDPTSDKAHTALALLHLYKSWNWKQARIGFEEAINQNKNSDIAHAHFAWYHVLFNNLDEAIYHGEKAVELNPLVGSYRSWLAMLYFVNEDFEKAELAAQRVLQINEKHTYANLVMGWVNLQGKNFDDAIAYHEKLPNSNYCNMMKGYAYMKAGETEKANELWNKMLEKNKTKPVNQTHLGFMAAYMGNTDKAFELLNEAVEKKNYPIPYVNFYPYTEDIRHDPRFAHLLRKMNLPYEAGIVVSK